MEPTEAQKKWFWEQCGFTSDEWGIYAPGVEHKPWNVYWENYSGVPPIDLNNLFKYAVPFLQYANIQYSNQYPGVVPMCSATASVQFADNHTYADNDPALALFWAVYKAFGGE